MRILIIVHGFPPTAMGGTEIYTHDFARVLRNRCGDEVFVLAREADPDRAEYALRRDSRNGFHLALINNTFRDCRSFEETYRNPAIRQIGAALLDEIHPDVCHVQHLTCLSTEIIGELAARRIPTIFTLNDYWLICHRGQLLDLEYRLCPGPYPNGCGQCLGPAGTAGDSAFRAAGFVRSLEARLPPSSAALLHRCASNLAQLGGTDAAQRRASETRLRHMRDISRLVTHFLAPSNTLRARFLEFGIEDHRISYREQGIDQAGFKNLRRSRGDRLRIGFMGSLLISKGPQVLLEAFSRLPRGVASLYLFGGYAAYHGDDRYRHHLEPLLSLPEIHHVGPVPHNEVPSRLASLDVLVAPSIWIENAPFVIREAFAAKVPVVASNLGGMAEMVRHERNGLLFEAGNAADLSATLTRLLDEPGLLDRLRAGIPMMRTMEEDVDWTRSLYASNLPASSRPSARTRVPASGDVTTSPVRVAAVVLNYCTADDTLWTIRSLQASRRPIQNLIVVDNGSSDGSGRRLRDLLPEVTHLQSGTNLGFSGGSNVGIREALARGADLVLLVNSDVILPPDSLARLEEALAAAPDLGIVGPLILSRSEPEQVASDGMTFSRWTGRMRHLGFGQRFGSRPRNGCSTVDGVSGCVMLIKREVFERIGLFAEEYFFSFEDLDFCLRANRAGFRAACVDDAVAYHEGSVSIGSRSASRLYFATRNHLLVASRATPLPVPGLRFFRSGSIIGLNLAHALLSSQAPVGQGVRAVLRGSLHYLQGRFGDEP